MFPVSMANQRDKLVTALGQVVSRVDDLDFGKLPGYLGYQIRLAQSSIFRDLSRSIKALGVVVLLIGSLVGEDPFTAAMPAWYRIACWALVIPCAVLGAKLAVRDRSVPVRNAALAR